MRLTDFKVLTFDCYGTLIDWETGIVNALRPVLDGRIEDDEALEAFARHESRIQAEQPNLNYRKVLAEAYLRLCGEWKIAPGEADAARFGASVPDWPAFPDSAAALATLKQHYKLVILSNIDRQSFAASNRRLSVAFDAVYTAEDVGTYKPDRRNFEYMLKGVAESLGAASADILHTAQSLFHDHQPARQFGLATCWISRRQGKNGGGATVPVAGIKTDFEFPSLAAFAAAHEEALALA